MPIFTVLPGAVPGSRTACRNVQLPYSRKSDGFRSQSAPGKRTRFCRNESRAVYLEVGRVFVAMGRAHLRNPTRNVFLPFLFLPSMRTTLSASFEGALPAAEWSGAATCLS